MSFLDSAASYLAREAFDSNWVTKGMLKFSNVALNGARRFSPTNDLRHLATETQNRLSAFHYFKNPGLYAPATGDWESQVAKARELGSYTSIWLMEGIAGRLAESAGDRVDLRALAVVPDSISESTMTLHTGAGTVSARNAVEAGLRSGGGTGLTLEIERFLEEAEELSHPGYRRCTVEALGLVIRNLYPNLLTPVGSQLANRSLEDYQLFWHGSGRGLYFNPLQMMPGSRFRHWVLENSIGSAPSREAVDNIIAGFFWALSLVNLRQPEAPANAFANLAEEKWAPFAPAIINGVSSALLVWKHLTGDEERLVEKFIQRQTPGGKPNWLTEVFAAVQERFLSESETISEGSRIAEIYLYE
ncbi:MAG: hypothetical protein ACI8UO_001329 [Verrucomicrobiales bacterium]|jgi:hypothetical protein